MINPIEHLGIYATPFGGELELFWKPRTTEGETTVVFRALNAIDPQVVSDYFANPSSLPSSVKAIVLDKPYNAFVDTDVNNGAHYYYAVAAKNDTEATEAAVIDGTPLPTLKFNVKDGKDMVYKAVKKMLENIYSNGKKTEIGKDINIVKNYSLEPIGDNWIMLERVNGSTMYKFWANQIADIKNVGKIKGEIDVDVIRGTFLTLNSSERRDTVYSIFKANKQVLIRMIKKLGAINCDITLEGDYYNPAIHGNNATGFIVVFNLLVENKTLIPEEQLTYILGELEVG